ncbi:TIGR02281 family clan AA aspartic protease [Rhodoferax sp.]|uniref:retropepsin-like aspartic protease family protein n=1 Tax=Rhodoferax sp. TaxID=50421 RepID=UPI0026322C36|nr:TIGR02281 family clan AA aspartic protease [Rhodoferax sp.]MDD2925136.1 TIGR02281 family clan AA aspartic protease [Rhodoferax sp.]
MGIQDRDWYRDAQREKEKQRQMDETRSKFSSYTRQHLSAKDRTPRQLGLVPMMIFWCAVMGLLYVLMTHYLKPRPAKVMANGDLVLKRSQDGHFYTLGKVNGVEAKFMVDTGASLVTVSEDFANRAWIRGGVTTVFKTANGDAPGRIVDGAAVSIGPISVANVRVGVGLRGHEAGEALLGQSFLSKFDIIMDKDQMVIRQR